jgi:uncharacterized protein (UPF0128 family)
VAGDAVVVEAGLERELEMWREQGFLGLKAKGRVNLEMGNGYMEEGLRMGVVEVEVAAAAAAAAILKVQGEREKLERVCGRS